MNELYKKIDDLESLVKGLKVVNQERQIAIDNLVAAAVETDNKLSIANLRIKELKKSLNIVDK